jgi:hypothetical protein
MNRDRGDNPDSWGKTAVTALAVLALIGACAAAAVFLGVF